MLIVGIAGGTGSGKTTVVRRLIEMLPPGEVVILPQDSYYKDNSHITIEERQKINFDHPDAVEFTLLMSHLAEMRAGRPIEMPVYSYLTCLRSKETIPVQPAEVVVVEGILVLVDPGLRSMLDIIVFVGIAFGYSEQDFSDNLIGIDYQTA